METCDDIYFWRILPYRRYTGGSMKNAAKIIFLIVMALPGLVLAQTFTETNLGVSALSYDMVKDVNDNIYLLWRTGTSTIHVAKIVNNSLTESDSFTTSWVINSRFSRPRLAVKPDGSEIHTCFVSNTMTNLAHVWRDSGGAWHEETVWTYAGDGWYMAFPSFGVDAHGYVHLITQKWKDPLGSYVPYWRKTTSWSSPVYLQTPSGSEEYRDHSMNTDKDGGIHATWKCMYTLGKYRYTASGGNLADSPTIDIPNLTGNPGIVDHVCYGETCRADNGDVHHIYFHYTDRTFRHVIKPNGSASFNYPLFVASADNNEAYYEELIPSVDATPDGRLFCTWAETKSATTIKYVMLAEYSGGTWSTSLVTDQASISLISRAPLVITPSGLYIVWRGTTGELILSTSTDIIPPSISVSYPGGGEEFGIGDTIPISWSTENLSGNVEILLRTSDDTGGYVIDSSVAHDGSPYNYTIPSDVTTGFYFIRVQQGAVADDSGIFEIVPAGTADSITVTYPNGGETFEAGSSVTLTWDSTGDVANVRIEFSPDNGANWTTLFSSVPNTGSYTDTIPSDAPESSNCLVRISDESDGWPSDTCDGVFTIVEPITTPLINLNRNSLFFGSNGTATTQSQSFVISNSGIGTLNWTVSDDSNWLSCTPTSGTETGKIICTVDPSGLGIGTYTGTVTVSDTAAANSPQTLEVTLNVYNPSSTSSPFGYFDTPVHNSTVRSSIPVTGWALDDIEVDLVKIYRDPVTGEPTQPNGLVYIGDAVFVEGSRPDVEVICSTYPLNYRSGWGYMLLTYGLPDQGMSGTHTLHAIAYDKEGKETELGTKTIICDNQNAVKPFGAIDTPTQGGEASTDDFVNFGWALTPLPNTIPTDGSTINVFVDGVDLGNVVYNNYREDIATMFPGYNNSGGAVGYFHLDTTGYENGVHTIAWGVTDNAGNADGLGSRYFNILNVGASSSLAGSSPRRSGFKGIYHAGKFDTFKQDFTVPLVEKGGSLNFSRASVSGYSAVQKAFLVTMEEVDLIRIKLFPVLDAHGFQGYLKVGGELRPLPIGSTLDREKGIFYWQPGPGFLGEYDFLFIQENVRLKKHIKIIISPKTFR